MPTATPIALSLAEARRLAVASQGFGARPAAPGARHVRALAARLHAFQIDSVNVLTRAHYVPAFARLGPYPARTLDALAYGRRRLFEYWGHAACLLPVELYPLFRYRMHGDAARSYMRSARGAYLARVYEEVAVRGPLAAADLSAPGKRRGNWWGWADGKAALEYLYTTGLVAIAGRRGFERLYDLSERVIPPGPLAAPAPPREEAMKHLICLGARACGVGTLRDIAGYLYVDGWHDRLPPGPPWEWASGRAGARAKPVVRRLVAELVEAGRLLPARVEGWRDAAYAAPGVRVPRAVHARALVTPFDSLVWDRARIERLFGMQYTIEIYTPPAKRVFGYYVLPFLLGDTLVARCDLKADRAAGALLVRGAFSEPGQRARDIAPELAAAIDEMRAWLALGRVEVDGPGDLTPPLRRLLQPRAARAR